MIASSLNSVMGRSNFAAPDKDFLSNRDSHHLHCRGGSSADSYLCDGVNPSAFVDRWANWILRGSLLTRFTDLQPP